MVETPTKYLLHQGFTNLSNQFLDHDLTAILIVSDHSIADVSIEDIKKSKISKIQLFRKQNDQPLHWAESVFGSIFMKSIEHEFVVIQAEGIFISADFMNSNGGEVQVRICRSMEGILRCEPHKKRGSATMREASFFGNWEKESKTENIEAFVAKVKVLTPTNPYNKIMNNCSHFARNLYKNV